MVETAGRVTVVATGRALPAGAENVALPPIEFILVGAANLACIDAAVSMPAVRAMRAGGGVPAGADTAGAGSAFPPPRSGWLGAVGWTTTMVGRWRAGGGTSRRETGRSGIGRVVAGRGGGGAGGGSRRKKRRNGTKNGT